MKNLIIILLFNLAANSIIFAQNTNLDSVAIYHTNYFLDSILHEGKNQNCRNRQSRI